MVFVIVVPFPTFVDVIDEKESGGPITQVVSMFVTMPIGVDVTFACEEGNGCTILFSVVELDDGGAVDAELLVEVEEVLRRLVFVV